MSLLDSLIRVLSSIESDKIAVHDERCVVMRNRNVQCLRCMHACTSGALAVVDGNLEVHPERCIGCGTCAAACPTSAIEIRTPTDIELTRLVKRSIRETAGHPVIACERATEAANQRLAAQYASGGLRGVLGLGAKGVRRVSNTMVCTVPCLGRVDESLLAGMAAYGSKDATLVCGQCGSCNHEPGGIQAMDVIDSAENLIGAFGSDFTVSFTEEMPDRVIGSATGERASVSGQAASTPQANADASDAPADPSRRAAFGEAARGMAHVTADVVGGLQGDAGNGEEEEVSPRYRKVNANGTLSRFVPDRRTMLYNYLAHLGKPSASEVKNRVIGRVIIDTDKCNSCRMCAVFCPTGALDRAEDGDFWGLVHRPAACVQCRSCECICPKGAIKVDDTVPIRQFLGREAVLFSMHKPEWEPNRPDSMFNKIHSVIGKDLEMSAF